MTILEAIRETDARKPNTCSIEWKIRWLSRLDGMVKAQILDPTQEPTPFAGYDETTPVDTSLLVEEPYTEVYIKWLEAQIDYQNREFAGYNIAIGLFNALFEAYANAWHRTHMPKKNGRFRFG